MRALAIILCLLVAAPSGAADLNFTGFARDLDSGALLYVETHEIRGAGSSSEQRTVLYRRNESAEPFARKSLTYGADRSRPAFRFSDQRSGFAESVVAVPGGFEVQSRAGANATVRSSVIPSAEVAVIDAGFDEFVRENWDQLQGGGGINAPFLVPSRLDAINFRVRKASETRIDGAPASVIRLSLAGVVGWLLPDIEVTYRNADRRLMRYRGLTNIRDADGDLISAQIDFPDPRF